MTWSKNVSPNPRWTRRTYDLDNDGILNSGCAGNGRPPRARCHRKLPGRCASLVFVQIVGQAHAEQFILTPCPSNEKLRQADLILYVMAFLTTSKILA